MFGYSGKILHIDLTNRKHWVEEKSEIWYKDLHRRSFHGHPSLLGEY